MPPTPHCFQVPVTLIIINIYRQFSTSPQVWGSLRLALIIYHFAEQKWYLLPACSIWLCVKLQSKQTYGIHMIHNTIYIHTQKIHHELPRVRSGSPQLLDNCTSFITWTYVVHCYWSKFHGCPCLSFKLKCISTPYSWFHEIQILSTIGTSTKLECLPNGCIKPHIEDFISIALQRNGGTPLEVSTDTAWFQAVP